MDGYDGTPTAGRKGIAYDWRHIVRESEFSPPSDELDGWATDEALAQFLDREVAR